MKRSSKEGYTGGYSILTDYVRDRRRGLAASSKPAYVPLKFELGEAFQFDWSDEWLTVGGIHRKIQAAHTKRCARRAFFLSAHPTQAHEMPYDAHARAFTALGGVPRRGIYGNMKTAVDKVVKRTNGRVVNSRFYAMTAHYLFGPDFCNVASGWEKGIAGLYSGRVDIHAGNAPVARHQRLPGRDQVSYGWQHYIPLIGKKPGALRNGPHMTWRRSCRPSSRCWMSLLRLTGLMRQSLI